MQRLLQSADSLANPPPLPPSLYTAWMEPRNSPRFVASLAPGRDQYSPPLPGAYSNPTAAAGLRCRTYWGFSPAAMASHSPSSVLLQRPKATATRRLWPWETEQMWARLSGYLMKTACSEDEDGEERAQRFLCADSVNLFLIMSATRERERERGEGNGPRRSPLLKTVDEGSRRHLGS